MDLCSLRKSKCNQVKLYFPFQCITLLIVDYEFGIMKDIFKEIICNHCKTFWRCTLRYRHKLTFRCGKNNTLYTPNIT